jgi:hypothetical protein
MNETGLQVMQQRNEKKVSWCIRPGALVLIGALYISILLSSCQSVVVWQSAPTWNYSDLRLLQLPTGENPHHEISAVYARMVENDFQIRLDLLDSHEVIDYQLYVAIDAAPGGGGALPFDNPTELNWDVLIHVNEYGQIRAFDKNEDYIRGLNLRLFRDTQYDMVVISMDRSALRKPKGALSFQIFLLPAGRQAAVSQTAILSSDGWRGSSPPPRANIMLVFWDTFPASSPSQALRRWDGAHTGPDSDRHGLSNLLRALSETNIPAVLLDLKTPSALSALDYAGGLSMVQEMERQRLLFLPDAAPIASAWSNSISKTPEWAILRSIEDSKTSGKNYGFRPSPYLYYPSKPTQEIRTISGNYRLIFNRSTSMQSPWQATADGPSIEIRLSLLEKALESENKGTDPLILGGSLAESNWGNYQPAYQTLRYLKTRPWVKFVSPDQHTISRAFIEMVPNNISHTWDKGGDTHDEIHYEILRELQRAPEGIPAQLAWQFYQELHTPPSPIHDNLAELRKGYIRYVDLLLAAVRWVEAPGSYSHHTNCDIDLDFDGKPDCILASEDFFFILKPEGGYAIIGFARLESGIHQIIGASAQLLVGLSDPTLWKPELGFAGDPNQYRGAFSDIPVGFSDPISEAYSIEKGEGWISFINKDGNLQKTYRLISGGLAVDYHAEHLQNIQVPIIIDPGSRFSPGWRDLYQYELGENGLRLFLENGIHLKLISDQNIRIKSFTDSRGDMDVPENPNYEFPPGHFLPFPMVLAEITARGEFSIELVVLD